MTDKDKPDIQNSGISDEAGTISRNIASTNEKPLLHAATFIDEPVGDPTQVLPPPIQTKTEEHSARTEVLSFDEANFNEAHGTASSENALQPSRLRYALVVLLLIFTAGWTLLNFTLLSMQKTERALRFDTAANSTSGFVVRSINGSDDQVQVGDDLISINGAPFGREIFLEAESLFEPGESYTLELRRGDKQFTVELVAPPLSFAWKLSRYVLALLLPFVFLSVAAAVFFLKPNDKAVLLLVVSFCFASIALAPDSNSYFINRLPVVLNFLFRVGYAVSMACTAVLFHLFLVFPSRLRFARRAPALEYLLYAPCLIFIVLPFLYAEFYLAGWLQLDFPSRMTALVISNISMGVFLLAALAALLSGYFQASETDKRRIKLVALGFALVAVPNVVTLLIQTAINLFPGDWALFFIRLSTIVFPFIFAYAVARHKVIPVSLVVRRGLQYVFAKNALRLLLAVPVLGIALNVFAHLDRTLSEIMFNNSFAFYSFAALLIALVLLIRLRFSDWIDRKFFREQYNQEKILRELTKTVKQCDSISKLSHLVSNRIQSALHPESIYLFFRDDAVNSDFSLSYTKNNAGDNQANAKLAADSPLLGFMQTERGVIEIPSRQAANLPNREKYWLQKINANLLVPMHGTDGRLAGIFLLGEKLSEIPYTGRDKELLETLANQIALVHENLSLKDQMRREQKIKHEVLARFEEGNINLLKECPMCGKCFDRTALTCDADNSELTFTLPVERAIENRYRLENLIGRGGMGAVYQATDIRINRPVAVKILSGAMFGNREALRRFEREAQTAGKLHHRNIVTVFDYGVLSTEGAFLVMELIEGNTLSEVIKSKGKLDAETVVVWFAQVLNGLEAAHKAGIIHRDLKPDNILITRSEDNSPRLCILDFGLARFNERELTGSVTIPGTIMGTPGYMPPEQMRGERVDERSDLFAVGVIIYEALRGKRPFAGKTYQEITQSMNREITLEKNYPFAVFFKRALALNPTNRFAAASEMKTALLNASIINRSSG